MTAPLDASALRAAAPTPVRYVVLTALCLITAIAYIDRGCISLAAGPICEDLQLSEETFGYVLSAFFAAYTIFQLPTGWLGHLWGTRHALPLFALLWSAATGLGAAAVGVQFLLLSRLGLGAAEAGVFPCATSTVAQWFPTTRRALVSGLLGSFMGVGPAVGAVLTGYLLTGMSWRSVLLLYSVPGIIWAIWFYFWFRDRPEEHAAVNAAELALIRGGVLVKDLEETRPPTPWLAIFTSVPMWWINGQQFFKAAGYVFFLSWFPTYLQKTHGVNLLEAGLLTSLPHWALTVSPVVGGWISDTLLVHTGNRRVARQWLPAVTMMMCGGVILLAVLVPSAWLTVLVISLGAFFGGLSGPCAYALCMDMGGKHVATVFSTMNMSGNLGATFFPAVVPMLVAATGGWEAALLLVGGLYFVSGLCWLPFNPDAQIVPSSPTVPPLGEGDVLQPFDVGAADSTDITRSSDKD
jgi:ACS family glucarate transporter-like MFS transporter